MKTSTPQSRRVGGPTYQSPLHTVVGPAKVAKHPSRCVGRSVSGGRLNTVAGKKYDWALGSSKYNASADLLRQATVRSAQTSVFAVRLQAPVPLLPAAPAHFNAFLPMPIYRDIYPTPALPIARPEPTGDIHSQLHTLLETRDDPEQVDILLALGANATVPLGQSNGHDALFVAMQNGRVNSYHRLWKTLFNFTQGSIGEKILQTASSLIIQGQTAQLAQLIDQAPFIEPNLGKLVELSTTELTIKHLSSAQTCAQRGDVVGVEVALIKAHESAALANTNIDNDAAEVRYTAALKL